MSVDTLDLPDLGSVYEQQKDVITSKSVINIDFHSNNTNYGALNLVDPGASSTTELIAELLATLGVKLTVDIATNLLNAIYAATNNFQNANVTSMAFEVASVCLKAGAKRFGVADAPRANPEPKVFVNSQPVAIASAPSKINTPIAEQPAASPAPVVVSEEPKTGSEVLKIKHRCHRHQIGSSPKFLRVPRCFKREDFLSLVKRSEYRIISALD